MFLKEKSPSRRGEKAKAKPGQRDPSRARETRREEPNAARGEAPSRAGAVVLVLSKLVTQ